MPGGRVHLEVGHGVLQVLTHPWIRAHLEELQPPSPHRAAAILVLTGVDQLDTAGLLRAAPDATWQAFHGPDTDLPNLWLGYHPHLGLLEADHIEGAVVVPLASVHPDHRNANTDAHLRSLTTLIEMLDAGRSTTRPPEPHRTADPQRTADPLTGPNPPSADARSPSEAAPRAWPSDQLTR